MGQIIDFQQRRPAESAATPVARPGEGADWPPSPSAYGEAVLAPMLLWQSLLASYAAFWLAPFGLEVRPIPPRAEPEPAARATCGRR